MRTVQIKKRTRRERISSLREDGNVGKLYKAADLAMMELDASRESLVTLMRLLEPRADRPTIALETYNALKEALLRIDSSARVYEELHGAIGRLSFGTSMRRQVLLPMLREVQ